MRPPLRFKAQRPSRGRDAPQRVLELTQALRNVQVAEADYA
jgi:hypothetical protein